MGVVTADRKPTIGDAITKSMTMLAPDFRKVAAALGLDPDTLFDPVTDRLVVLRPGQHIIGGGQVIGGVFVLQNARIVDSNPERES